MKHLFVILAATVLMASCSGSSTSTETTTTDTSSLPVEDTTLSMRDTTNQTTDSVLTK
jgi:hypothetical protein